MNPVLLLYIFIAAFILWVLFSKLFTKVGSIVKNKIQNIKDIINEENQIKEAVKDDKG